jgi:hypothetical protein
MSSRTPQHCHPELVSGPRPIRDAETILATAQDRAQQDTERAAQGPETSSG